VRWAGLFSRLKALSLIKNDDCGGTALSALLATSLYHRASSFSTPVLNL